MPDHMHLLVGLRPDAALSELVRDIKANSSRFINEKRWVTGRFSWQEVLLFAVAAWNGDSLHPEPATAPRDEIISR
jgi:REP element-mobilizing transposase RayT